MTLSIGILSYGWLPRRVAPQSMQLVSTLLLILILLVKVSCLSPHSSLSACRSVEIGRGCCRIVGPGLTFFSALHVRVDSCYSCET